MELNINFTIDVVKAGFMINCFSDFLKPCTQSYPFYSFCIWLTIGTAFICRCTRIARRIFNKLPSHLEHATKHLKPLVEERWRMMEELGDDWTDKPVLI